MRERVTTDRWDIMGNYGYGWDVECSEYTLAEAKQTLQEYRRNGLGAYKLEHHLERIQKTKSQFEGESEYE